MELKDYPFVRCLNPKRITNPYTRETLLVGCGHCAACESSKASRYKLQIRLEAKSHEYCVFGTLTFAPNYVPRMTLVPYYDTLTGLVTAYDCMDKDTGEILGIVDSSKEDVEKILSKVYSSGGIPYLRKLELQLFFKRFRKYLKSYSNGKIRYYAMGEYGPEHYWPHYHFILFFDEKKFTEDSGHVLGEFPQWTWSDAAGTPSASDKLSVLEYCLRQSWKFGRLDAQYPSDDVATYVAGYVVGTCNLPKIYKMPSTRPFSVHSKFLGQCFLEGESQKVYQVTAREFIKRSVELNGTNQEFDVWRSCYSVFFPKCKGFACKSSPERLYTYQLYDTARKLFPYCETVKDLADETLVALTMYCYSPTHDISELDRSFRNYLSYFFGSLSQMVGKRTVLQYGEDNILLDKMLYNIYIELLRSRHFLQFCCKNSGLAPKRMLSRIEEFYSQLDYLHLTEFLSSQEAYFAQDFCDEDDVVYMYNNCSFSMEEYKQSLSYKSLSQVMFDVARSRIKHKLQNDRNNLFNNI